MGLTFLKSAHQFIVHSKACPLPNVVLSKLPKYPRLWKIIHIFLSVLKGGIIEFIKYINTQNYIITFYWEHRSETL